MAVTLKTGNDHNVCLLFLLQFLWVGMSTEGASDDGVGMSTEGALKGRSFSSLLASPSVLVRDGDTGMLKPEKSCLSGGGYGAVMAADYSRYGVVLGKRSRYSTLSCGIFGARVERVEGGGSGC